MERDVLGRTVLHRACIAGNLEELEAFLLSMSALNGEDKDSCVTVTDRYGLTALHYAVLGGHRSCVEALHRAITNATTFVRSLTTIMDVEEKQKAQDVDEVVVAELNPLDKAPKKNLTLSADRTRVISNVGWGSVRCTAGVRLGDMVGKTSFYEARVESGGIIQIGWATKRCKLTATDGVGDDRHSWAWDGFRKRIWHAGGSIIFHHTPLWQQNDVITAYVTVVEIFKDQDDEEGKMEQLFARATMGALVNGNDVGIKSTVQIPIESRDETLYPGVSLVRAEAVSLNFGYTPFIYGDRIPSGWMSVSEAMWPSTWQRLKEHVPFLSVPYPLASVTHFAACAGRTEIMDYLFSCIPIESYADLLLVKESEGRIPYHMACRYDGQVDTLKLLLAQQDKLASHASSKGWAIKQLEIHDNFGRTSLIHACDQSRPEILQFLLEMGVSPKQIDAEGVSALHHAIDHDCAPIVSLLLDYGADMEERDKLQDTAITFAAKNGALECIKLLVSRGADITVSDIEGSTLLLASLINGYAPLVKYLLTAGISKATERNDEGDSAFLTTCRTSSIECAELLLAHGASLNDTDNNGTNGLMFASSGKNPEMVRWLISKGLDVNSTNNDNQTPLFFAAGYGPVENLRILLEHGANPHHKRVDDRTPFLLAALHGRVDICKFLLLNGHASLEDRDRGNSSAIILASKTGSSDCARFLLEQGADANDADISGSTPLLYACAEGDLELVQLLISRGANTGSRNRNGYSPLLAACIAGKLEIIEYLLSNGYGSATEHDRSNVSALLLCCRAGTPETIEYLLSQGASLDVLDARDTTPLMYAANHNNLKLMEWLIDVKKVDIEAKCAEGLTALSFAVSCGHKSAALLLLDRGAKLPEPTNSTDPSLLARAFSSGSRELVEMLFERGLTFTGDGERRICIEAALGSWSLPFCRFAFTLFRKIDLSTPEDGTWQGLNPNAVELLTTTLADNHTVHTLDLSRLDMTDTSIHSIQKLVTLNRHLSVLKLKGNAFSLEAIEELLAAALQHNYSLLELQLDDENLQTAEEITQSLLGAEASDNAEDRAKEKDERCCRVRSGVKQLIMRNREHRRSLATTAIQMLTAARLLLQPPPITWIAEESPLATLPPELLEAIVEAVDGAHLLREEERKRVIEYALDWKRSTGKARHEFLRTCITSLTYWPDPSEMEQPSSSSKEDKPQEDADDQDAQPTPTDSASGTGSGSSGPLSLLQRMLHFARK